MQEFFQDLLESKFGDWNQTQKEALVDLCLLGMYSDSLISVAEQDFMENESTQLKWESGISLSGYLQRVIPKVRKVKNDAHQKKELLQNIADRLGNKESKINAVAELEKLLSTDGIVKIEEDFMGEVKSVMGI